jgi:hypothetical protein
MTPIGRAARAFVAAVLAGCGPRVAAPPVFDDAARAAVADTVRTESHRMLDAMRTRKIEDVLAYYGKRAAYVANGEIGDWDAIVRDAPPRYGTYVKVECTWQDPFRIEVLGPSSAVVTAILDCVKADTTGREWREVVARTEVLAPEDGRWRIVAVHESIKPGAGELR